MFAHHFIFQVDSFSGFTESQLKINFGSGGITPCISHKSDLDDISMLLLALDIRVDAEWVKIPGNVELEVYILHVRRTGILEGQGQSAMAWIFVSSKLHMVKS